MMVNVLTSPVTVSSCVTGVGDHEEDEEVDEDVVEVVEGVVGMVDDVVVGTTDDGEV